MPGFNHFAAIAKKLHTACSQEAETGAQDIVGLYQGSARRLTGAQADSAYILTNQKSTFAQAAAAAQADNPKVEILNTIPTPTDDYTAIAAVGANYAVVNELGGHGRTGDGALTNAASAVFGTLQRDLQSNLENKLR